MILLDSQWFGITIWGGATHSIRYILQDYPMER